MMAWLGTRAFLGLARWVWVLIAIGAVIAVVWAWNRAERADDAANQNIGRQTERNENLEEILERTEEGNEERSSVEAEAAVGRGHRLYNQCLLSNRGAPENCERFLPQFEEDNNGG